jgi:hypothetical protein
LESAKQIILEEGFNNEKLRKKEENLRMSMAVISNICSRNQGNG